MKIHFKFAFSENIAYIGCPRKNAPFFCDVISQ